MWDTRWSVGLWELCPTLIVVGERGWGCFMAGEDLRGYTSALMWVLRLRTFTFALLIISPTPCHLHIDTPHDHGLDYTHIRSTYLYFLISSPTGDKGVDALLPTTTIITTITTSLIEMSIFSHSATSQSWPPSHLEFDREQFTTNFGVLTETNGVESVTYNNNNLAPSSSNLAYQ